MNCHRCGREISRFAKTCKYCSATVVKTSEMHMGHQAEPLTEDRYEKSYALKDNTMKTNEMKSTRDEQRDEISHSTDPTKQHQQNVYRMTSPDMEAYKMRGRWSWGAFIFTWIWGLFNGTYIAFLTFVPFFGFIFKIVLGLKGNEWAYQNRKWESDRHYVDTMRRWNFFGLLGVAAGIVFFAISIASMWIADGEVHTFGSDVRIEAPVIVHDYQEMDQHEATDALRNEDAFFDSYTTEGVLISDILVWGMENTTIKFESPDSIDGGMATLRGDIVYMNVPSEVTMIFERVEVDVYQCTAVYLDNKRLDEEAQKTFLIALYDAVQWDYPYEDEMPDEGAETEKVL
jgi:hypothetical protein